MKNARKRLKSITMCCWPARPRGAQRELMLNAQRLIANYSLIRRSIKGCAVEGEDHAEKSISILALTHALNAHDTYTAGGSLYWMSFSGNGKTKKFFRITFSKEFCCATRIRLSCVEDDIFSTTSHHQRRRGRNEAHNKWTRWIKTSKIPVVLLMHWPGLPNSSCN